MTASRHHSPAIAEPSPMAAPRLHRQLHIRFNPDHIRGRRRSLEKPCFPASVQPPPDANRLVEVGERNSALILKHEDADTDTDTRRSSAFEGFASQPQFFHRICRASSGTAALGLLGMTRTE